MQGLPVGMMRQYGTRSRAQQRGPNRENPQQIPAGQCGFKGCNRRRLAGIWAQGGSYMCSIHAELLLPMRALWDKHSPQAQQYIEQTGLDRQAELSELKYEEGRERQQAAAVA
jgi:hypothetical protein